MQPLIGWTCEWEDWAEDWDMPRDAYRERIIDAAGQLLNQPWPPEREW